MPRTPAPHPSAAAPDRAERAPVQARRAARLRPWRAVLATATVWSLLATWPFAALPGAVHPGVAHAQDAAPAEPVVERRLITIDSSGGTQSGNLRYGPIVYEHPDADGVVATVSTLTIRGPRAELRAPDGELIARAQGRRDATFDGGVVVTRGRLTATGAVLRYAEATGLGVLEGDAVVRIAPATEGEPEVVITARQVTFDVDTDTSVSEGDVVLVNGDQSAQAARLEFEEVKGLGVLSGAERPVIERVADDGGVLRIVADEIRVLTDLAALYARGAVEVVDGAIRSTGDVVFYDDEQEVAEVLGDPAIAVDEAAGVRLETARVRQDVRYRFVEAMDATLPTPFDADQFLLERELSED